MSKYIPDIKSHRWVILATERASKPTTKIEKEHITKKKWVHISKDCPFCPGNETKTICEVDRLQSEDYWLVRAILNKYPITDVHEIIIHSPDHLREIIDMSDDELLNLFIMYQKRLIELSKSGVPILFRNKGVKAGTSLPHPHSQIIVLPAQINLEALVLEPIKNVVINNHHFVAYCPDFSQYPYEVWIAHKECMRLEVTKEEAQKITFNNFDKQELLALGLLLQRVLQGMHKMLGRFDYNYYISPNPPFYLRIIPRIVTRGGFELGTGLSTNIKDPIAAAEELKKHLA